MKPIERGEILGLAEYEQVRDLRYGSPFPCANAIAIVEVAAEPPVNPTERR